MKTPQCPLTSWRIAVISKLRPMDAQHYLDGVYRRAEGAPDVWIKKYDVEASDIRRGVLTPLREWKPHGVIVHVTDPALLQRLRKHFPLLPLVSVCVVPPHMVDTVVVGDATEMLTTVRDFFRKCGLSNIAIFCLASASASATYPSILRAVIPDGLEWVFPLDLFDARTPAERKRQRKEMAEGLRRLPKPVGIMTRETQTAPFLLKWCQELGWRVPEEVQIIGLDEEDLCLACEPRLTSLVLPHERIGEAAMDVMLRLLRREQPPPPPVVRVSGGVIIPRGSTAMLRVGLPAVAGAIARMQSNAARGMTAGDVTRLSKVGHTTLYKQFGAATGNTPGRYLRKMRLEEACRRLRETNDTVTAVGAACGFTSLQSFANFFRRQTGQTPTQYREAAGGRGRGGGKK